MKNFSQLNVKPVESKSFVGEKVKMSKVLNKSIVVYDYKIEKSKLPEAGNDRCLWLQIGIGENKHVVFTGSKFLISAIEQVQRDSMPFTTTIVENNEAYFFT